MVINMAMVHTFSLCDNEALKIKICDDIIFPHFERFLSVDTFLGAPDKNPSKGLDYCGYTFIPPKSLDAFIEGVKGIDGLEELEKLALLAKDKNEWIEHIGL